MVSFDSNGNTFQAHVKAAYKGDYKSCMRRSLQSVVLYEADRCLLPRYPQLRPFQKKYALIATAMGLLKTLDFLNDFQRQEVMFRTNSSKEPLAADLAWRRMKLITREVHQTIVPKAKAVIEKEENRGKTHDEICDLALQLMYEENSGNSKPHPPLFEYSHNNTFTVYRVYYRGCAFDPSVFPATPSYVKVPLKRPEKDEIPKIASANMSFVPKKLTDEERRALLKEVKDHTELLKEFEGVIPAEELAKRKRELYAALPPVPSPVPGGGPLTVDTPGKGNKKKKAKTESHAAAPALADVDDTGAPALADVEDGTWEDLVGEKETSKVVASV